MNDGDGWCVGCDECGDCSDPEGRAQGRSWEV